MSDIEDEKDNLSETSFLFLITDTPMPNEEI